MTLGFPALNAFTARIKDSVEITAAYVASANVTIDAVKAAPSF
jgi:hypothetical protein